MTGRRRSDEHDWLGLTEASSVVGVSPATLRRWSDTGRIKTFTTPGGHRRFSRAALERLLPRDRERRPTFAVLGVTPERVARACRRQVRRSTADVPWLLSLDDRQRELFREHGRRLAASLLRYLDVDRPQEQEKQLKEASAEAAEYGREAAALGLSLSQSVEGFLRFRSPFIAEMAAVARRRGLDTAEATELLQTAEQAMDHLLVATMTGHGAGSAGDGLESERTAG